MSFNLLTYIISGLDQRGKDYVYCSRTRSYIIRTTENTMHGCCRVHAQGSSAAFSGFLIYIYMGSEIAIVSYLAFAICMTVANRLLFECFNFWRTILWEKKPLPQQTILFPTSAEVLMEALWLVIIQLLLYDDDNDNEKRKCWIETRGGGKYVYIMYIYIAARELPGRLLLF